MHGESTTTPISISSSSSILRTADMPEELAISPFGDFFFLFNRSRHPCRSFSFQIFEETGMFRFVITDPVSDFDGMAMRKHSKLSTRQLSFEHDKMVVSTVNFQADYV
jgi:hypothetical protein